MSGDEAEQRTQAAPGRSRAGRLKGLVAPMLAGIVIDSVDLMTFGPIGLWTGMLLGGAAGYWLGPELGFHGRSRWLCASLAGFYCTLPMTGFLPAATFLAGLWHVLEPADQGAVSDVAQRSETGEPASPVVIEPEYSSEWDETRPR